MQIIIVGSGEVGFALARALGRNHDVFVIDHDATAADRLQSVDAEFVLGSGTSAAVLRRAQIERCDWFIACTGLDEVNVVACSLANQLGSPRTICFVSREDFLRVGNEAASLSEHFGIDRVLWPEAQLAEEILRIIAAPGAIDAEAFASGEIRLLEYRLAPTSPLLEGPIADLHLPAGSLIVAVKRGESIFIPHGATRLAAGDKIIVMGDSNAMRAVQERVSPDSERKGQQLVSVVGGGDVGFRLAQQLDVPPTSG